MIYLNNSVGWLYKDKVLLEMVFSSKSSAKTSVFASYFKNYTINNQPVTIVLGQQKIKLKTDAKGNLNVILKDIPKGDFDILFLVKEQQLTISKKSLIKVESKDNLIISDIDDTILRSHTIYPLKQLFYSLLPVKRRKVITNVQRFIVAMHKEKRDVIYVSNSSMNLKNYLLHFLNINGFPKGPLLLNDYQNIFSLIVDKLKGKKNIISYKRNRISRIMSFLNDCSFGLIGDNSQQDPNVFLEIAKDKKERVDFIAVRNALLAPTKQIEQMYAKEGQEIYLFDDNAELELKHFKKKMKAG